MSIEEAKELVQTQLDGLIDNPNVTLDPKYIQAELVAIASLDAWGKVEQDIKSRMETIIGKYDSSVPEHDRASMKIARNEARRECLDIINKYFTEV